jgi:hypothetical protein
MPWDLEPGERLRRVEVHDRFGGTRQSGVAPSRVTPNVLLFSDPSVGSAHGYDDHWSDDGTIFYYAGRGQTGDQTLDGGNGTILNHREEGRTLRVFWGAGGTVEYAGEFEVDPENPYDIVRAQPTGGGADRNVVMFRLRPLGEPAVIDPARPARRVVGERTKPTFATPYRRANESPAVNAPSPFAVDPNEVDRALAAHARTQNALERHVAELGFRTHSPGPSDPDFDLAWRDGDTIVVAEVKSLTERNERGQLRLGIGQILDYEQTIRQAGLSVSSVLCVERPPADAAYWLGLCARLGVRLIWPPSFGRDPRAAAPPG